MLEQKAKCLWSHLWRRQCLWSRAAWSLGLHPATSSSKWQALASAPLGQLQSWEYWHCPCRLSGVTGVLNPSMVVTFAPVNWSQICWNAPWSFEWSSSWGSMCFNVKNVSGKDIVKAICLVGQQKSSTSGSSCLHGLGDYPWPSRPNQGWLHTCTELSHTSHYLQVFFHFNLFLKTQYCTVNILN